VERSGVADLLVVGNRGRGGVRSALLGSVALHCVTHARCPVLVVHETAADTGGQRIVVGLDGSAGARAALDAALDEAARTGADVEALVAFAIDDYWTDFGTAAPKPPEEVRRELSERAERDVAEVLAGRAADAPPVAVRTEVVDGAAQDVLVERSRGARLLVVGSRGHGTLRGLLLGSVALHCAMHAVPPVLVVHPGPAQAGERSPVTATARA
jgi:nucleotide-binding universal stress UspA family protein